MFFAPLPQGLLCSQFMHYGAKRGSWQSQVSCYSLSLYILVINQDELKSYRKEKNGGPRDPKKVAGILYFLFLHFKGLSMWDVASFFVRWRDRSIKFKLAFLMLIGLNKLCGCISSEADYG